MVNVLAFLHTASVYKVPCLQFVQLSIRTTLWGRQDWDYSHFTDMESKAKKGKATLPKSHCSVAEPLGDRVPLSKSRSLRALKFLRRAWGIGGCSGKQNLSLWILGLPLSEWGGGQAFRGTWALRRGEWDGKSVRGQDAIWDRVGELHRGYSIPREDPRTAWCHALDGALGTQE